ncbi:rod shape-determining protein RodA [Fructilactobacillus lindneri]|uniref:Cell division membrane protein n=2 Tax=Fructilactobacillus lindneri TaxID=53444 RepID=A0A0R2JPZ1_9LACO|nr:FtsW/RodA/SpoVE family cell cycle protein [Fructilactobacillus lindneri]ANZ58361.1 rod shape-determining protein RodA [Fructilactobacillus lindneri]ANZ59683.1 rod shape-determining protein RodA [Fructilactobacillus lindneri]KRN79198.1 cell division membrane protein [Fructilactobacillus lindneri DSM 20690 = JCM 11027]POG98534.1 rod shape-determining protein RodA [Fructilactobacillus lindneri]POH03922.1 rod shape-determining protein RodA [Fructilactobacillus lindneri]
MFRKEQVKDENRIDWGIIFCVLMLALVGLASIFVAAAHDTGSTSVVKAVVSQLIWYAIGAVAIVVIMQFDSEQLWKIAPYAYGVGIFLLFAVLFLYSRSYFVQTGAKSWFAIGPLTFQPSEIMKPAYILMEAKVIAAHNNRYPVHTVKSDWKLIGVMFLWTLPVIILLKLQNDFGTTIVFIAILGGLLIVSGITWKILGPGLLIFLVISITSVSLVVTKWGRSILSHLGFQSYQFARIDSWLHPASDSSNQGFQLWQSMKAIGSGGVSGTGFNVSKVYVPVRESDMIFSVVGENFGFIGGVLLILLYFLLIYEMIKVTFQTKNVFYAYISTGVIMMILFHVVENIGMSIDLIPMTGIPLPFISQGGSALIGNMIGIGLIMSMQYHNKSSMFSTEKQFS